jgi:type IV pilus assembly protein PilE
MMYLPTSQSDSAKPSAGPAGVRGFTLIELLVTCACVAILASIAIASYEFAIIKTRRGAAQACLTDSAQFMERWYTTNLTYAGAPGPSCGSEVGSHYAIAFSGTPDGTSYTLQISPQGRQAEVETKCGTMTFNQAGQKSAATDECWR